jgi:hypothetical protein
MDLFSGPSDLIERGGNFCRNKCAGLDWDMDSGCAEYSHIRMGDIQAFYIRSSCSDHFWNHTDTDPDCNADFAE